MTIDEAIKMLKAKRNCIANQCKGIYEDCNKDLCDSCVLCYEQGTMGQQQEAITLVIEQIKEKKDEK